MLRQDADEIAAILRRHERLAFALDEAGFHQLFDDTGGNYVSFKMEFEK